ncbi:MAG: patatin-like phospholipase family protein [Myxococcota bacterium]
MGLTLIQRGANRRFSSDPKIALVLAGGAVSGGGFKVGGLMALDDLLVGRKVNEFDLYVGLSAGAFLAAPLAWGIPPDEMVRVLEGTSERFSQLRPIDFYWPNLSEMLRRPVVFWARVAAYLPGLLLDLFSVLPELPATLGPAIRRFVKRPNYTHLERLLMQLSEEISPKREMPSPGTLLPSGLFDNAALEKWLRRNMESNGIPNDFAEFYRESGRKLYITATNLDTAERVVFGPENDHGLRISEAVQASSALPGFFKPARLGGVDYVDGGVRRTANIDVAVEQGADLVICYNPFRPFLNQVRPGRNGRLRGYLADGGMLRVFNQALRTLLHTRLALGLQAYLRDEHFSGDIVVIEARETDEKFFSVNPIAFWKRAESVRHGFESVRRTLLDHVEVLAPVLARYGLELRVPGPGTRRRVSAAPSKEDPSKGSSASRKKKARGNPPSPRTRATTGT